MILHCLGFLLLLETTRNIDADGCRAHSLLPTPTCYKGLAVLAFQCVCVCVCTHVVLGVLTKAERKLGVWEKGSSWRDGRVQSGVEITGDSQVKLVRHGALR